MGGQFSSLKVSTGLRILRRSKERLIVEYALRESAKPIGVGTYRMAQSLPQELIGLLPTPEQVARLLEGLE